MIARRIKSSVLRSHTRTDLQTCILVYSQTLYSYLNTSAGFRLAARQVSTLTVRNATTSVTNPAKTNIHQERLVLYAKLLSHWPR